MASALDGAATTSTGPTAPEILPAHPEQWSQEQRDAAAAKEAELFKQYRSDQPALDAIFNFKTACKDRSVDYADAFLTGNMTAEEYKKVDDARRVLTQFWRQVRKLYNSCKLVCDDADFFSPNKRWFRMGNEFRELVEPLDIANWYKAGNHEKGSGHYWDSIADGEDGLRPSHYAFLDRLMKDALMAERTQNYVGSVSKAEVYKREVAQGHVQIHKLADARADPPKGFLRVTGGASSGPASSNNLVTSGDASSVQDGQRMPPPSIDVPDVNKTHSGSNTPTTVIRGDATTPDSTPTPRPAPDSTVLGDLRRDDTLKPEDGSKNPAPGWKKGVPFRCASGSFKAPRAQLPEPKSEQGKSLLRSGQKWSDRQETRAGEIEVRYNTLVYETASKKYLVVRAQICPSVHLTDDDNQHCGYFQESLTFSMHVPGDVEYKPGTLPLSDEGSEVDVKITQKQGRGTTLGAGGTVQVNAAGPSAALNTNVARTHTREQAEEHSSKTKRFDVELNRDDNLLTWTWTVKRMDDGSPYVGRQLTLDRKYLRRHPAFGRTGVVLDVQGTWSFEKAAQNPVVLNISVGRTMRYDAVVNRTFGENRFETSVPFVCDPRLHTWPVAVELAGLKEVSTTSTTLLNWDA